MIYRYGRPFEYHLYCTIRFMGIPILDFYQWLTRNIPITYDINESLMRAHVHHIDMHTMYKHTCK
jgi:hypothetical protein